jgi:acyl-coenzyme A synthetase/AMP-(fatty) acid ligase
VIPSNIEKHMMTHPAIEDCGVVGLPHDVHGELPLAFVVLRSGVNVTAEELIQYTNGN